MYEIEKSDIISHEEPSTVVKDKKELLVKTRNGVVSLLRIQPENKKKMMMASDFFKWSKAITKRRCI